MHQRNTEEKICPVCQRPFSWRKKWAKVWDSVKYCSKSCNAKRNSKVFKLKYE
ncbi:MAG: DUF2256 domain-containing protein [Verrucomicrobia bacterium]|nr:DUF2256 domain-containing protein [Verrucomicrobiota bacterium]